VREKLVDILRMNVKFCNNYNTNNTNNAIKDLRDIMVSRSKEGITVLNIRSSDALMKSHHIDTNTGWEVIANYFIKQGIEVTRLRAKKSSKDPEYTYGLVFDWSDQQ